MFGLGCSPTKRDSLRLACHTGGRGVEAAVVAPALHWEKPKAGPLLGGTLAFVPYLERHLRRIGDDYAAPPRNTSVFT